MQTGTKISAIAHVTLVGWALFGGTFRSEPLPFDTQDVSVISAEEFAAITAAQQVPDVTNALPDLQQPPEPAEDVNAPQPVEDEQSRSDPVVPAEPEPEVEPEPVISPPDPEVIDQPPALDEPDTQVAALPVPPGPEANPRPADKVAPQPVAPPPPDVKPDDVETPPVSQDEGAETQQDQQEQTAPEEATDQIVTEAEESDDLAPERSPRPLVRRPRPPAPAETEVAEVPVIDTNDAVRAALEGEATQPEAKPSGPPLTGGEKDALRVAVSNCWNVGSLSTDALKTTVVVSVAMNRDGTPINESIRLLSSSGGSSGAAQQAFGAARRAIIRCGAKGYDLPADKYAQWQDIEMTFNPERMRIK